MISLCCCSAGCWPLVRLPSKGPLTVTLGSLATSCVWCSGLFPDLPARNKQVAAISCAVLATDYAVYTFLTLPTFELRIFGNTPSPLVDEHVSSSGTPMRLVAAIQEEQCTTYLVCLPLVVYLCLNLIRCPVYFPHCSDQNPPIYHKFFSVTMNHRWKCCWCWGHPV